MDEPPDFSESATFFFLVHRFTGIKCLKASLLSFLANMDSLLAQEPVYFLSYEPVLRQNFSRVLTKLW